MAPVQFGIDTSIALPTVKEDIFSVSRYLWSIEQEWSKSQWVH